MAQFCTSPVSRAIIDDNIIELQKLIDEGRRIDVQDNRGYTPLHLAIDKDSLQIVNILLKHEDLEIDTVTYEGVTPLLLACSKARPNLAIIQSLLDFNANVNAVNKEYVTSLHFACKFQNIDLVRVLLDYGANINCQDFNEYTPLHYALEQKSINLVAYLLERNANANITELHGLNSLMFAIVFADNCVQIIMPHIANLNAVAKDNKSAIVLACAKQNIPVVKKLLELGARVSLAPVESSAYRVCVMEPNFELFKIIWEQVKWEVPLINNDCIDDFICVCIQCWGLSSVEPYEYLLSTPGINFETSCIVEFLATIVKQHAPPFDTYKTNLFRIINLFLDLKIMVSQEELIYITRHYNEWKYAPDLIELILRKSRPHYEQSLILLALTYSNKMGHDFLKYCYIVDSNIFEHFESKMGVYNLQFLLKYFTPTYHFRPILIARINRDAKYDEVVGFLNCNKVASLKELSRNVYRQKLLNCTRFNREFFNVIEALEVPIEIKNILLFREPLYNYFQNN